MTLRERLFQLLREHNLPVSLIDNLEEVVQEATKRTSTQPSVSIWDEDITTVNSPESNDLAPNSPTVFETPGVFLLEKASTVDFDFEGFQPESQTEEVPLVPKNLNDTAAPFDALDTSEGTDENPSLRASSIAFSEAEFKARFKKEKLLGEGGMAEVYRALDRRLDRHVALKIVHPHHLKSQQILSRFLKEADITAKLDHPNIIPIYEMGIRHDHRPFFTMKEVKGATLDELIQAVHSVSTETGWGTTEQGWNLRGLLRVFKQVCEAVGYAHSQHIIHRDLKPKNIIIGGHGEVLVVDWGLAKRLRKETPLNKHLSIGTTDSAPNMQDQIIGTPGYMSPEQLTQPNEIDETSDVYSLGTILYEILAGRPAFLGYGNQEIIFQMLSGLPSAPGHATQQVVAIPEAWSEPSKPRPPESNRLLPTRLMQICARAMARKPEERYDTAQALALEIGAWLDGLEQRRQAIEKVRKAQQLQAESEELAAKARQAKAECFELKRTLQTWDPAEMKQVMWEKENFSTQSKQRSILLQNLALQSMHEALLLDPELEEAHHALLLYHQTEHYRYEVNGLSTEADIHAQRMQLHLDALSPSHQDYNQFAEYLKGNSTLTFVTEPPGAAVSLYRWEAEHCKLNLVFEKEIGKTPLLNQPLPHGNYVLKVSMDQHRELHYPLKMKRLSHQNGDRPGDSMPSLIQMVKNDSLSPKDCIVPQGWTTIGEHGKESRLLHSKIWVDAFVIQQHPVTHREYLNFLNALVKQGNEEAALQLAPRILGPENSASELLYDRSSDGTFQLFTGPASFQWLPEHPVVMINWLAAHRYAEWFSQSTGLPWRLPWEVEWEKAARGVDGRLFPWGKTFDACLANTIDSQPQGQAKIARIDEYPTDQSVYNVRGLAGNVSDWCLDSAESPTKLSDQNGVFLPEQNTDETITTRISRGGSWMQSSLHANVSRRNVLHSSTRRPDLGFRLVRPY